MPAEPGERRVEVAPGVSVAVRVHPAEDGTPEGTPVLAVHGLASNARMWDGVAQHLAAAGHAVAAVDQRGHGRSDKPEAGYDFETLTADLVAVLDHLGWERAVVAGQSWGGNVTVELAARRPERVDAAVLVDGGTIELSGHFADWPTCEAALAPPLLEGTPADRFEQLIRGAHPDWPETGIAGTLANFEFLPDGTIRPWLSRQNHMQILRNLWEHHPSRRWAELSLPVLVLAAEDPGGAGGRFESAKRNDVERAGRTLSRSRVVWIPGDHDLHAQHPGRVSSLIHDAATGDLFPPLEPA